jgi:hypothetical protein
LSTNPFQQPGVAKYRHGNLAQPDFGSPGSFRLACGCAEKHAVCFSGLCQFNLIFLGKFGNNFNRNRISSGDMIFKGGFAAFGTFDAAYPDLGVTAGLFATALATYRASFWPAGRGCFSLAWMGVSR